MQRAERIDRFVHILSEWYAGHRRELPWRDLWSLSRDDRAYRVLVSEVMLQQTQVSRVIGSFKKFIQEFPHAEALAQASNRDVLVAWRGMGYNSRALRLRDGARMIRDDFNGRFPENVADLRSIKGIGPYTAGAIRTFAFDLPTPCIDTNIRRILHRTFVGPEAKDGSWKLEDASLLTLCAEVMDAWLAAGHRGSDFLSALMDFGSLVQTKSNPKWDLCPLTKAHIMKTKPGSVAASLRDSRTKKSEPGRMSGGKFVPNRIFRGRVVDVLRDHPQGLTSDRIGEWISSDYRAELKPWVDQLIKKLVQDRMLQKQGKKYVLAA